MSLKTLKMSKYVLKIIKYYDLKSDVEKLYYSRVMIYGHIAYYRCMMSVTNQ